MGIKWSTIETGSRGAGSAKNVFPGYKSAETVRTVLRFFSANMCFGFLRQSGHVHIRLRHGGRN